jgi:hypothetical protein
MGVSVERKDIGQENVECTELQDSHHQKEQRLAVEGTLLKGQREQ